MALITFHVEFDDDLGELTPEQHEAYGDFLKDVAEQALIINDIQSACGGSAASHPDFPIADWMEDVEHLKTRLGYWEWVSHHICTADDGEEDDAA